MTTLTFKKLIDFSDLPKKWEVTSVSFDWDSEPLLLIEEGKPPRPDPRKSIEAYVSWVNTHPTAHHVLCWDGNKRTQVTFEDSRRAITAHVQRFEDGWLLGEARGGYTAVHDASGRFTRKVLDLGDASEDLQTTAKGHIWVSYFDEGVFGSGIGASGLICFDSTGTPVFKYSDLAENHQVPYIDDCYALNVINDDEVWLCYYADFPLVCLREFKLAFPPTKLEPIDTFAIADGVAVCSKAYTAGELFRKSLVGNREHTHVVPVDERGNTIKPPFEASTRGSKMCLKTDTNIYVSV